MDIPMNDEIKTLLLDFDYYNTVINSIQDSIEHTGGAACAILAAELVGYTKKRNDIEARLADKGQGLDTIEDILMACASMLKQKQHTAQNAFLAEKVTAMLDKQINRAVGLYLYGGYSRTEAKDAWQELIYSISSLSELVGRDGLAEVKEKIEQEKK